MARKKKEIDSGRAESYKHNAVEAPLRPDVGTLPQFRGKKAPAKYRFDSSLSPAMDWDENPSRGLGEWLLAKIEEASKLPLPHRFIKPQEFKAADRSTLAVVHTLGEAVDALKRLGKPLDGRLGRPEESAPWEL